MTPQNSQNYKILLKKYTDYLKTTIKKPVASLESGFEAQLPLPHKTFSIFFLVAAVIFVGLLLSIYIWFRPSPRLNPSDAGEPRSAQISSADKLQSDTSSTPGLYQNQEFGFELKYPGSFTAFRPDMPYYRFPTALLSIKSD